MTVKDYYEQTREIELQLIELERQLRTIGKKLLRLELEMAEKLIRDRRDANNENLVFSS